ncbi:MAG: hypothetical protein UY27_C0025G0008 [Candidatus Gottesmanbacteria bacterium GW2011_GWA1_48_13]|uniref:Uncharacterized protein n=1 Tax=Candidatus Gottesmanbacteria bacterium GW2011_GWA1_48_13 TaxID=1618439 RepID=A0A0G1UM51_9BACT|nr:MAG: hypothetical protein UY27_C0025G0008 [Candidatus Gottesmanbacteria bacterium GW2011_GWA1_48_13]
MAQLFYDHLIVIEEITAVLDEHTLTKEERAELLRLIDQTLHHEILDTIFTHLPKERTYPKNTMKRFLPVFT